MHRFTQVHRRLAILFPQVRFFFAEIVGWDTGYYRLHPLHKAVYIALADVFNKTPDRYPRFDEC